jgi:hypothetical protein
LHHFFSVQSIDKVIINLYMKRHRQCKSHEFVGLRENPMKITLNTISYTTAISLAAFSGGVATFGMMKLVPGAEIVVGAMGLLFEAGKLTSFAILHSHRVPRLLRGALATVGLTLMSANVAGVSGFLSNAYERTHINAQATTHTAESTAHAEASLLERQLAQAETAVAQARTALVRARDDRGRVKAAQAILTASTAERDRLLAKLSAANSTTAQGNAIASTSEFAAVQFIAGATGADTDTVAHAAILTISAVPDILAVLLLLAAGYGKPEAPVQQAETLDVLEQPKPAKVERKRASSHNRAARKGWQTRKRRAFEAAVKRGPVAVK